MARLQSQSELDYPSKLLEYINGFRVSKRPLTAGEVSQGLGTSEHSMEQLLDVLAGLEILKLELAQDTAFYSSTDVSNLYLAKSSPKSLHDMIIYQSQTIYPLWNNLVDAVREGRNQNEKTFGLSSEDIFSAIYRSEEEMLNFMGLMNSTWTIVGHDVVSAFDLRRFQSVVDVGGCTGALARELAKTYPTSTVTVLDLPKVVQMAQKYFSQSDDTLLFLGVDVFEEDIPAASLYILARILHDWKQEKCLALLRKLHSACQPGGGVLLVESLLFENRRGPIMAQLFSLNMLVQTEGRERPPSHYTHMLTEAGFSDVQVRRTGKSYDAILALK